jgi:predicted dehydrogenase
MGKAPAPSKYLTGIVIGAGIRGSDAYAPYLLKHPEEGKIVAVAEPNDARRAAFCKKYSILFDNEFKDYRDLLVKPKLGDFAIVTTQDQMHVEPAILAMERGYDVLLEKPMAITEADCRKLVAVSEKTGCLLQICHVLRYSPFFRTIKDIADAGALGKIVTIQHSENVSHWHYAHSYCRGNWRNQAQSSPMILAKSCHDMDILYWLANSNPVKITSLTRPTELCEANKPKGAPRYCIEGCPHTPTCQYDAVAVYKGVRPMLLDFELSTRHRGLRWVFRQLRKRPWVIYLMTFGFIRKIWPWRGFPVSVMTTDTSDAGIDRALRTTNYGKCVYQVGDNDQVSSQTVNILFASGMNASFTMHTTSYREGREIRVDGTKGSIHGWFYQFDQYIRVIDHKTGKNRWIDLPLFFGSHGGGDQRLFAGFLAAIRGDAEPMTTAKQSLQSHLMAFAADKAQREGIVIDFTKYS